MAGSTVNTYGTVKGGVEVYGLSAGGEAQSVYNPRGDLLTAASLPPMTELVRLGRTWGMRTDAGIVSVALDPTTLAMAVLYNGEAVGSGVGIQRCYVIHTVFAHFNVTAAAATQFVLMAQLTPQSTMVAPTHSATTTLLWSKSGKGSYSGLAKRAVSVTTAFQGFWEDVGVSSAGAAANVGTAAVADVQGSFIVPPGAGFHMNIVSGTVTGAAGVKIGCTWSEVDLLLG
jgi:hypothetical protein